MAINRWMDKEDVVHIYNGILVLFFSVAQLCLTLCDPVACSTPGFPVLHHLPELAQIHVHWVSEAIQPSRPLSSPSPPACNLSQHQGLSFLLSRFFESGGQSDGILLSHKKNEIMPFATTWMDLEMIILSKVNQKHKDKYYMISLICGI